MSASIVSVTGTVTTIIERGGAAVVPRSVLIKVPTGGETVYISDQADVNTTEGFPIAAGETFTAELHGSAIYGIADSTQDVNVLFID